jgi:hypothetical protein
MKFGICVFALLKGKEHNSESYIFLSLSDIKFFHNYFFKSYLLTIVTKTRDIIGLILKDILVGAMPLKT